MASDAFYAELPCLSHFDELIDSVNFVPVPDDWVILVTDVENSTDAIALGKYKAVNMLGASSIAAVVNVSQGLEIPFVFGGDGATLLVPASLEQAGREALLATQAMAAREFKLILRVAAVPVKAARAAGYEVAIAKLQVSPHYRQANFTGGGLTFANDQVKLPHSRFRLAYHSAYSADFTGLECRWQDIPSQGGHTVSLIVAATPQLPADPIYHDLLQMIRTIYDGLLPPVTTQTLNLTFNPAKLSLEVRARARRLWAKLRYFCRICLENSLGLIFMGWRIKVDAVDWGDYKDHVVSTTDFQKFDDRLQMVLAGTPQQTVKLLDYLQQQYQRGQLNYGLHIADRAVMTCLVYERLGNQVHFIDGADGGYTAAAANLKLRREPSLS